MTLIHSEWVSEVSESHSVVSDSLQCHGLHSLWNSPGQNTGVVAFPSPGDLPNPGIEPASPALQADSLPTELSGKPNWISVCVLVAHLCLTLCNPMDCNPSGSSVHEIFQARILEWVAISFSRGSSQPRDQTRSPALQANSLPTELQGKPSWISSRI